MIFFKIIVSVKPDRNMSLFNNNRLSVDGNKFVKSLGGASIITVNGLVTVKIEKAELAGKSFIVMASVPGQVSPATQANIFEVFEKMFNNILSAMELAADYMIGTVNIANNLAMFDISRNHTTLNQMLLDKAGFKNDLPEEFLCKLSGQMMDEPVTLPGGVVVELEIIMIAYNRNPVDPFTGLPFNPELLEVNEEVKNKIDDFLVLNVLAKEQVRLINAGLDNFQRENEDTSNVGSPYGIDNQRYNVGSSIYTVLKTLNMRKPSGVIEQYTEEHHVFPINFPHKSKTETAVKDLFHAIRNRNFDKVDSVMNAYPLELRKHLVDFGNKLTFFSKLELQFKPQTPKPLDQPHLDERCGYTKVRV
jgi:hypothetical protein